MSYKMTRLKETFSIKKIISVHYFEFEKDYIFSGEKHPFWELVYVDKGEISIYAENEWIDLYEGQIYFHKPMEFHNLKANGIVASNVVVIAFDCLNKDMSYFESLSLRLGSNQQEMLARVIKSATETFKNPLGDPFVEKLTRKKKYNVVNEQIIKNVLELFLIDLFTNDNIQTKRITTIRDRSKNDLVDSVIKYLNDNFPNKIKLEDIANHLNISQTSIKNSFKDKMHMGVIQYYNKMKIESAKIMIREGKHNFSQIALKLGFESVHYFSRCFVKYVGMSPTEYGKSVKIIIDNL